MDAKEKEKWSLGLNKDNPNFAWNLINVLLLVVLIGVVLYAKFGAGVYCGNEEWCYNYIRENAQNVSLLCGIIGG